MLRLLLFVCFKMVLIVVEFFSRCWCCCGGFCFIGSRTLLTKHNKIARTVNARPGSSPRLHVICVFVLVSGFWLKVN